MQVAAVEMPFVMALTRNRADPKALPRRDCDSFARALLYGNRKGKPGQGENTSGHYTRRPMLIVRENPQEDNVDGRRSRLIRSRRKQKGRGTP